MTATEPPAEEARPPRPLLRAGIGLVVLAAAIAVWAVLPFDDHVPLELPEDHAPLDVPVDELPEAARFECPPVLGPDDEPELSAAGAQALEVQELTRAPCRDARDQRRVLLVVDAVVVVAALVLVMRLRAPREAPAPTS